MINRECSLMKRWISLVQDDKEISKWSDPSSIVSVSYRWTALPIPSQESTDFLNIPYQRYGHTAVAKDENAFIWGGRNDSDGACNILFCFNTGKLSGRIQSYF